MKAEQLNPFIQATIKTFATMAKMQADPGRIHALQAGDGAYDVTGRIALSGGASGYVALGFPRGTAHTVVAALIGGRTVTSQQINDGVGELANIVAGAAKRDLGKYRLEISLPQVIMGAGRPGAAPVDAAAVIIPFRCPAGLFDLAIRFQSAM